jgi:hypothetical protein
LTAPTFRSRVGRRAVLTAIPAFALALDRPAGFAASARQPASSPTLLVRGEASLAPGSPIAWRIVRDVAEPMPEAPFERRALGFAVATSPFTALLVTDQATGSAYRLTPGEASFVRDGTWQRREVLHERPDAYLRIGLVPASEAEDAGGDRLLFAGPAFDAPAGTVTLALSRAELAAGDAIGLPPGAGETLVLVEQGEVELEVGEAAPRDRLQTVVASDTSYAVRSVGPAAMLYGTREVTRVLLATIA